MKITAQQLLTIADSNVLSDLSVQKLSPVVAYRMSRLVAIIGPEAQRVQQARNAMFTPENSTTTGQVTQVKLECVEGFMAAVAPILGEVIDIAFKPLTLDDLAGVTITANQITALGPLLTGE